MHQFTNKDIDLIKTKLTYVCSLIYADSFDFNKYITLKLITLEQCAEITKHVKASFPSIELHPMAAALYPLIDIVKNIISEQRTTLKPKPKRPPPSFYSYTDDDFYHRSKFQYDDDY